MARQIRLDQIDDVMSEAVQKLVAKVTLDWTRRAKKATPQDTGNLFRGWQTDIQKFKGTIINPVVYAEPVIYGTNLPPSWKGIYRTRRGTIKGFPNYKQSNLRNNIYRNNLKK